MYILQVRVVSILFSTYFCQKINMRYSCPSLLTCLLCCSLGLSAQHDLRRDAAFFRNRQYEYQRWLDANHLGNTFRVDDIFVQPDRLTIVLAPAFSPPGACDSLQAAWYQLRERYYRDTRQALHTTMLEKLCFQMDLPLDSAEIRIFCPGSTFRVRIYGERADGQRLAARFEENQDRGMGSGDIKIPVGEVREIYRGGKTLVGQKAGVDIRKIRRMVGDYFYQKYHQKGTRWLWNARIDTSSSFYNEFTYKVTHISGEVLKGRDFFEFHKINVKIEQIEETLTISWSFQAKYGGGLIYPPREASNDYHDLETSPYKSQFDEYQQLLFRQLEEQLRAL